MSACPPVVGVINSSQELVELLKVSLEQAGLLVVSDWALLEHPLAPIAAPL